MVATGSKLAFIVGHYKSGSSWLSYQLCLHPAIRGLSETHIFRYTAAGDLEECTRQLFTNVAWADGGQRRLLRNRISEYLRPFRQKGQATLGREERPTTLLDLSLRDQLRLRRELAQQTDADEYRHHFFDFICEALEPPRYLVEKTPTNIAFVPEIRRVFPASKLIAIHRDGRDVVVSDKYHRLNQYGKETRFEESVIRWKEAMETHLQYVEQFDVFSLTYEELLHNGAETTTRLLDFLAADSDPAIVEDMLCRSSFEFITGRGSGEENSKSFFRKGTSGDWVNHFSQAECRSFSAIAGETLVALGYEESPDPETWDRQPVAT